MKPVVMPTSTFGSGAPDADRAPDFPTPGPHRTILYLEGVTVTFDGIKALNNVNLLIYEGKLRCVIGPHGAGNTTMMDLITGETKPDSRRMILGMRPEPLLLDQPLT